MDIKYPGHMKTILSVAMLIALPLIVTMIEGRPVRGVAYGIIPMVIATQYLDECGITWKNSRKLTVLKYTVIIAWFVGVQIWIALNPYTI